MTEPDQDANRPDEQQQKEKELRDALAEATAVARYWADAANTLISLRDASYPPANDLSPDEEHRYRLPNHLPEVPGSGEEWWDKDLPWIPFSLREFVDQLRGLLPLITKTRTLAHIYGTEAARLYEELTSPDLGALSSVVESPLVSPQGELKVAPGSLSCHDSVVLGVDEHGQDVTLNLVDAGHGAIQGVAGSGKTVTLSMVVANASLMRDVQLHIIASDPAAIAPWWRTAHQVTASHTPHGAIQILREVRAVMQERVAALVADRQPALTEFSPETPLILVVIPELPHFLHGSGDAKLASVFLTELRRVAMTGARCGVRLWLSGQLLGTALSTLEKSGFRPDTQIFHRMESPHEVAALIPELAAANSAMIADVELPRGVAIVSMPGHRQPLWVRVTHLTFDNCWAISDAIVAEQGAQRPLPTDPEDPES